MGGMGLTNGVSPTQTCFEGCGVFGGECLQWKPVPVLWPANERVKVGLRSSLGDEEFLGFSLGRAVSVVSVPSVGLKSTRPFIINILLM